MEHNVDKRDEKVAVVGRAEHRFEPGVAEKVHINLGVEVAEFVFGEVDAEIVRTVFEETEEVLGAVAGDGRGVGCKSIITTTDLGFDKWDQIFTDKVIAAAIVDRLTLKAFIIDMEALHTISRPLKNG